MEQNHAVMRRLDYPSDPMRFCPGCNMYDSAILLPLICMEDVVAAGRNSLPAVQLSWSLVIGLAFPIVSQESESRASLPPRM